MNEISEFEPQVTSLQETIAVLGALSMTENASLTVRGIFENMPIKIQKVIVEKTSSWYMGPESNRWRDVYIDHYVDSGHIQVDPEDSRRLQITERGQKVFEDWLNNGYDFSTDVKNIVGEERSEALIQHVIALNPQLSRAEATTLIGQSLPEATAYMQPASNEDIYQLLRNVLDN